MKIIRLISEPNSPTSKWLKDHFGGETTLKRFVEDVSRSYRTRTGERIPEKNVYALVLRDERRGLVVRETRLEVYALEVHLDHDKSLLNSNRLDSILGDFRGTEETDPVDDDPQA
jgi:hypothetical protein